MDWSPDIIIQSGSSLVYPAWMGLGEQPEDPRGISRRVQPQGCLMAVCDGAVLPASVTGQQVTCQSEHFTAALVGAFTPARYLRMPPPVVPLHAVRDSLGREWLAPQLIDPHGRVLVQSPLACVAGVWQAAHPPRTARAIAAAQAAAEAWAQGREVDLAVIASWTCCWIELVYHLDEPLIGALGLIDQHLIEQMSLLSFAGELTTCQQD